MRRIAITCGDPSGVGPELIERCLAAEPYPDCRFLVFGNEPWLDQLKRSARAEIETISLSQVQFEPGRPTPPGARVAIEALERAAEACLRGDCDAVVTGPISKERCVAEGFAFPGQTEFFASRWGGDPTMAFVGDHLKVCLATWHIPLREVPSALSRETLERATAAAVELGQRLGIETPRILICGLNPHAGENGLLGAEERDMLNPWVEGLRRRHSGVEGCVPGDTAFARAMRGEADVVVALYHDQGLAPFKAVDFDTGVNVTLGLTKLRTSPDHGTGFEIAGQGSASAMSMARAIALAARLSK